MANLLKDDHLTENSYSDLGDGQDFGKITTSRRLARFLSQYSWYCPPEARERLDSGWELFEKVTLPRYYTEGNTNDRDLERAPSGDKSKPTQLYSILKTKEKDLGDFGIGIGLYFSSLRHLIIITLIAGLILLPNMAYFSSDSYDNVNDQDNDDANDDDASSYNWFTGLIMDSSAICHDASWAPCPTCTSDQKNVAFANAGAADDDNDDDGGQQLVFVLVNSCRLDFRVGFLIWLSLIVVSLSILGMNIYRRSYEEHFDESELTGTDYTIQINNPPHDAVDPEEYRSFFNGICSKIECGSDGNPQDQIVAVTVAMNNQELTRALVQRRTHLYDLESRLPEGFEFKISDPKIEEAVAVAWPLEWYERLMMYYSPETLKSEIILLDKKIHGLINQQQCSNEASTVFVTFQTEESQRAVFDHLSSVYSKMTKNVVPAITSDSFFRGTALHVVEPKEPASVRWLDLADSPMKRYTQLFKTTALHLATIIIGCILIFYCNMKYGSYNAALVITCLNSLAPYLCAYLVAYESHPSDGSLQSSQYIKTTLSLWIQTTIITNVITPFTNTLSSQNEGIIYSVYAIYIFEIVRGPAMQFLDIYGQMERHIFAPRAPDQRRMNLLFQGVIWNLSERYTSMTNIIFLSFFYSTIFPAGFFLSAFALLIHYWTDKFCLLRNWAPAPKLGSQVAKSSAYFFLVALAVFAVCSSYTYAGFPFDNACQDEGSAVDDEYVGDHVSYDGNGREIKISVEENDPNYVFCLQSMAQYIPIAFPPIPSSQPYGEEWMNEDQEKGSKLLGYTALAIALAVVVRLVHKLISLTFYHKRPFGKTENKKFSNVEGISAYIPQVKLYGYPFPLILCDLRDIDNKFIGWTSPRHHHDFYNVIYDIPGLECRPLFSIVKQWTPHTASSTIPSSSVTNNQHELS